MSSGPLDLPVLISQLPYVQKLAHAEKAKPEIQKALFAPVIAEHLRKAEGKVKNVEKRDKTNPVDQDGKKREEPQAPLKRKAKTDEPVEEVETEPSNSSPWSGNIVNVKI